MTRRLSRNQALVMGALERAAGPLTAYAILDALREEGLRAPQQVYRALERLIADRQVHRIESLNAFVGCAAPDDHHATLAAFAICRDCGQVTEFADAAAVRVLSRWCRAHAFVAEATTLEVRGLCAACRGD